MYHMAIELHSSTQELEKHGIGAVEYQTITVENLPFGAGGHQ